MSGVRFFVFKMICRLACCIFSKGGTIMKNKQGKCSFTYDERLALQKLWDKRTAITKIARYFNCSEQCILTEIERGNTAYFQTALSNRELSLLIFNRTYTDYSAKFAQAFVDKYHLTKRLEQHNFTPALKYLLEQKLKLGMSPEYIVQNYAEIPITARTIRNYIKQGYLEL